MPGASGQTSICKIGTSEPVSTRDHSGLGLPSNTSLGPLFDGPALEPIDSIRLGDQLRRVFEYMRQREWVTLRELNQACGVSGELLSEASASARIRDLRKEKFGGYTVDRRRSVTDPDSGLFEYRLGGRDR